MQKGFARKHVAEKNNSNRILHNDPLAADGPLSQVFPSAPERGRTSGRRISGPDAIASGATSRFKIHFTTSYFKSKHLMCEIHKMRDRKWTCISRQYMTANDFDDIILQKANIWWRVHIFKLVLTSDVTRCLRSIYRIDENDRIQSNSVPVAVDERFQMKLGSFESAMIRHRYNRQLTV